MIKLLQAFVTLAKEGAYTKAARALGISQPSVSLRIKSLEDYLGCRLVDRSRRPLELTREGDILFPSAEKVVSSFEEYHQSSRRLRLESGRQLRVGSERLLLNSVHRCRIVDRLIETYPADRVEITNGSTDDLFSLLYRGELDVLIANLPGFDKNLDILPLFSQEVVVLCAEGHKFCGKELLSLDDLNGEKIIIPRKGTHSSHIEKGQALFKEQNIQWVTPPESDAEARFHMVRLLKIPAMWVDLASVDPVANPGDLAIKRFTEPKPHIQFGLVKLKARTSPAITAFWKIAEDEMRRNRSHALTQ